VVVVVSYLIVSHLSRYTRYVMVITSITATMHGVNSHFLGEPKFSIPTCSKPVYQGFLQHHLPHLPQVRPWQKQPKLMLVYMYMESTSLSLCRLSNDSIHHQTASIPRHYIHAHTHSVSFPIVPLHASTYLHTTWLQISNFAVAKFDCPHTLADGN